MQIPGWQFLNSILSCSKHDSLSCFTRNSLRSAVLNWKCCNLTQPMQTKSIRIMKSVHPCSTSSIHHDQILEYISINTIQFPKMYISKQESGCRENDENISIFMFNSRSFHLSNVLIQGFDNILKKYSMNTYSFPPFSRDFNQGKTWPSSEVIKQILHLYR